MVSVCNHALACLSGLLRRRNWLHVNYSSEKEVERLLKNYDHDSGDSYYRAVLQNLFFATLNTEIKDRRFSKGTNSDHRNFSVYRYKNQMSDPNELLALFAKTPFINGGLFDCLDDFEATRVRRFTELTVSLIDISRN